MAKRFQTIGNYFVVTDTDTDVEEIREAKANISYKDIDNSIHFYRISTGKIISVEKYNKDTVVNGDNSDAPFADTNALKNYLNDNTAFRSASGGSGASTVPNNLVFLNETARDNYFLNNPSKKINGVTVLVEQPTLTLERWNGVTWDNSTAVIKGDTGVGLSNITSSDNNDGTFDVGFTLTDGSVKTITTPDLKGKDGSSVSSIVSGPIKSDNSVDLTFTFSDSTTKVVNIPLPVDSKTYSEEYKLAFSSNKNFYSSWVLLAFFSINTNKSKITKAEANYNVSRQYPANAIEYQIINQNGSEIYFSGQLSTINKYMNLYEIPLVNQMPKTDNLNLMLRGRLINRNAVVSNRNVILTIEPVS